VREILFLICNWSGNQKMKGENMLRRMILLLLLVGFLLIGAFDTFAYDNHGYSYNDSQCRLYPDRCHLSDPYGFCRSHCTSYSAYMLNLYGVSFDNWYLQPSGDAWHDGGLWDSAADRADIAFDNYPLPGDIAYWNTMGHVAFVEKVYFNSDGNPDTIDITEYNYNACVWGWRNVSVSNPDGFIHILAYNEGVTGLFYLDSYETSAPGQTQQEWGWIANRVWNNYRCTNCSSNYSLAYINALAGLIGGMGGGPGASTEATENPTENLPDFIMDSLVLKDNSGNERYLYNSTETIVMHSYSKNIGDANWAAFEGQQEAEAIDVRFYLSNGYKEDAHNEWIRIGIQEIQKGNLDMGETKNENASLNLATTNGGSPLAPGVYNIVACADRNADEDNEDGEVPEKHKSNNCSTEAVFTVQTFGQQAIKWLVPILNIILR
jgi:surface antigen